MWKEQPAGREDFHSSGGRVFLTLRPAICAQWASNGVCVKAFSSQRPNPFHFHHNHLDFQTLSIRDGNITHLNLLSQISSNMYSWAKVWKYRNAFTLFNGTSDYLKHIFYLWDKGLAVRSKLSLCLKWQRSFAWRESVTAWKREKTGGRVRRERNASIKPSH